MAGDDFQRTSTPQGYTHQQYFALLEVGLLNDEDRVEVLDGVIVVKPASNPRHAAAVWLAQTALLRAVGDRAMVRVQSCLIASPYAVPEPDVAVVPWAPRRYADAHPTTALLLLEVADSSLPQDRLSKSRIYAGDAVPQYIIVNLRTDRVEVFTDPDPAARVYGTHAVVSHGERIEVLTFPGTFVAADDLLPDPG